jgi:uncharacterized protein YggE
MRRRLTALLALPAALGLAACATTAAKSVPGAAAPSTTTNTAPVAGAPLVGVGSKGTGAGTTNLARSAPALVPATPVGVTTVATPAPVTTYAGPTITTEGTGTVSGTPDTMTISIGTEVTAPHATDALSGDNARASAVIAALEHDGVASSDIRTEQLSLSVNWSGAATDGYQASNSVTATVRSLARAGSVIDDAVAAAGDAGRLEGVSFSIDDTSPLLAQARQRAVADARLEADQLAAAAGTKVSGLLAMTEQSQPTYPVAYPAGVATSAGASAVPVQPGVQNTTVVVNAVWSLAG